MWFLPYLHWIHCTLEFPLDQSQCLIWFLPGFNISLLLSSDVWILLSHILCFISCKLLTGPRKSLELILLVNQTWALISPGADIFPDFGAILSCRRKKRMPTSPSSPVHLPQHPPRFPWRIVLVTLTQQSQTGSNSKKHFWSYRIFCVLMQSMVFYLHQELNSAWHSSCCSKATKFSLNEESEESSLLFYLQIEQFLFFSLQIM